MARGATDRKSGLSRRDFLITTGGALAGMARSVSGQAAPTGKRHPQRGGTLHYGPNNDAWWPRSHIQNQNHIYQATASMYNGLTDIDQRGNIVPSLAESWESNKELTAWTFRLRKGVLFHNGRELDAEAVKLNIMRIKDPAIGHEFCAARWTPSTASRSSTSTRFASTRTPNVSCRRASCATPPSSRRPTPSRRRQTTPSARGRSSSSPGRAGTRPGWCALKTTGRPMPRAIACPTWTKSSSNSSARTQPPDGAAHRPGPPHQYHGPGRCRTLQKSSATSTTPAGIGPIRRQLCGLQLSAREVSGQAPAHRGGARHRPQRHSSGGVLRERR